MEDDEQIEIDKIRAEMKVGVLEAKRIRTVRNLRHRIFAATDIPQLRSILVDMLELIDRDGKFGPK